MGEERAFADPAGALADLQGERNAALLADDGTVALAQPELRSLMLPFRRLFEQPVEVVGAQLDGLSAEIRPLERVEGGAVIRLVPSDATLFPVYDAHASSPTDTGWIRWASRRMRAEVRRLAVMSL